MARVKRAVNAQKKRRVVLERASFVCCDSKENARLESGDLIEPVAGGVLDWLEVHELQGVVARQLPGRDGGRDSVSLKATGPAAAERPPPSARPRAAACSSPAETPSRAGQETAAVTASAANSRAR